MKIWHDDIRKAPDESWTWARTNADARALLRENICKEISLDHDLGLDKEDPDLEGAYLGRGTGEATGLHLVDWMIFNDLVPEKVTIHSWNPVGADRMARTLRGAGHHATVSPYRHDGN